MLLPFLLASAAFARTECPAGAAAVHAKVSAALSAYVEMDEAGYDRLRREVDEELACLTEVVTPALSRDVHLLEGLQRFLDGDRAGALLSLRALLQADWRFSLSTDLAPQGHPFRALFDAARKEGSGEPRDLLAPQQGALLLDGRPMRQRPADRAAIVQWAAASGQVCWTGYLDPSQNLPAGVLAGATAPDGLLACLEDRRVWEVVRLEAPAPPAAPAPEPAAVSASEAPLADMLRVDALAVAEVPPTRVRSPGRPLAVAAAGTGLAAGGLLAAALVSRAQLLSEAEDCTAAGGCGMDQDAVLDDLDGRADRVRMLGYGAQAAFGVAAGLGVVAVVLAF